MSDYTPRGLYFEDCEVGLKVTSAGRTISEADIMLFAGLSGTCGMAAMLSVMPWNRAGSGNAGASC